MTTYTPETIITRLTEAYWCERVMPDVHTGPRGFVSFFRGMIAPQQGKWGYLLNYSNMSKDRTAIKPTPFQIDQMHEALDWFAMIDGDGYRRALMLFIHFKVYRGSVSKLCQRTGLNRRQFYRQKDQAILQLTDKLNEK